MKLNLSKLDLGILVFLNTFFAALFFFTFYMALSTKLYEMLVPAGIFFIFWNMVYYNTIKEITNKISTWKS
jgi:hypothetical protein